MTFQAYLDTIKLKTGLDPEDFRRLAEEKGLLDAKPAAVIAWLKQEFDLGPGHAMALIATFRPQPVASDRLEKQFAGAKAKWRAVYEDLLKTLTEHGAVGTAPTDTYISLLRGKSKFGIVATTTERFDVGLKWKDAPASPRLEPSGSWNAMVTHRVRVTDPAQVDAELLGWLRAAYDAAG